MVTTQYSYDLLTDWGSTFILLRTVGSVGSPHCWRSNIAPLSCVWLFSNLKTFICLNFHQGVFLNVNSKTWFTLHNNCQALQDRLLHQVQYCTTCQCFPLALHCIDNTPLALHWRHTALDCTTLRLTLRQLQTTSRQRRNSIHCISLNYQNCTVPLLCAMKQNKWKSENVEQDGFQWHAFDRFR